MRSEAHGGSMSGRGSGAMQACDFPAKPLIVKETSNQIESQGLAVSATFIHKFTCKRMRASLTPYYRLPIVACCVR